MRRTDNVPICLLAAGLSLLAAACLAAPAPERGREWVRHTIDGSSRGADGTRLADINGDGLLDITTGWEEGGVVRAYLNPGPAKAREPWPAVTAGRVGNVEDALFVDLDGDGAMDVVSACEGSTRTLFIHWRPKQNDAILDPKAWKSEAFPVSRGKMQWMFTIALQIDGKNGVDLVCAGKNQNAAVGWLEAPPDARDLAAWKWHPMSPAGWVMSLVSVDMDGDGDQDVLLSDRYGELRGCRWLENPGPGPAQEGDWANHFIGGRDYEMLFLTLADVDGDGLADITAAVRQEILLFRRTGKAPDAWETILVPLPPNTGGSKAVAVADLDGDGRQDIAYSCEHAGRKSGLVWLGRTGDGRLETGKPWDAHEVSGLVGTKYDLVVPIDLDGDGDLDLITSEETENLGVIWYENPSR